MKALQTDALLIEVTDPLDQITQGSSQTVKSPHNEGIS